MRGKGEGREGGREGREGREGGRDVTPEVDVHTFCMYFTMR